MGSSLLLLCLVVVSSTSAIHGQCESGWIQHGDSCYKIVRDRKPWPEAEKSCDAMGADLAIVMSYEENDFLKNELRKLQGVTIGDQFWMDGSDLQTEGKWIWSSTGESFEISDFHPGEPNQNGGNEDCLAFFARYDFDWNDEHCTSLESYICEKEPIGNVIG